MQLAMQRRHLFAMFTTNKDFTPRDVLERDWDDDTKLARPTAEPLDWHECRQWPVFATTD